MGLHARLVDAEDFSPLQGTVHVRAHPAAPQATDHY
jgi:hypothetical protein